ncbi:DNA polymerase III subunit delta [Flavobacteriaceae bacterium Ap0902]|nr:DNA polymerase III subunit delta [Flavobacteriaceae bacterium Ap0902]
MKNFESIRKDIQNKKFVPIYFFYGDEPYFMDALADAFQANVLTEEEKAFNEHVFYGSDTDMNTIVMQARQYPMMAEKQLIIVKEAQHLKSQLNDLESYVAEPLDSTVLVFIYKHGKPDGRSAVIKSIKKNFIYEESKRLYENQIPDYIETLAKKQGLTLVENTKFLLAESIGDDLSRIHNELVKLKVTLNGNNKVTPELVEKHIGISKDYNNFELTTALANGNMKRAFEIVHYFGENPKDNSIFGTIAVLFNFFSKVLLYQSLSDKSRGNVASKLKINPFFVQEYATAAKIYPIKKVTKIISYLRETDMKAKGVGATGNVSEEELMRELLYKIFRM